MDFNKEVEKRFTKKDAAKLDSKFRRTPKRILIKNEGKLPANALKGTVVAALGKMFIVEDFESSAIIDCTPAGTVISVNDLTSLIAVGDIVYYIPAFSQEGNIISGSIAKVEPRDTILSRKAIYIHGEHVVAANCENLLILMAAADPFYNKRLIDRFIVSAEQGEMKPAICINKIDLMDREFLEEDLQAYKKLSIPVFYTCATAKKGIRELRAYLRGSSTVISGPSGVGKSTIINCLVGEEIQAIGDISESSGKGVHTTSYVRMFKLPSGGAILDTPGIREFGIIRMEKAQLALYFHDFDKYYDKCRYMPCSHTHEPGCAVKSAVEDGIIDPERYISYTNMYESIE